MDELNIRINQLIADKNLTKSAFASKLDVSLPMITHITNGRNKPGIEIIQRILVCFKELNPSWLILGIETMYKEPEMPVKNIQLENKVSQLITELAELQKTNNTTLAYHKLMMDEVLHLAELDNEIILANSKLGNISNQLTDFANETS